MFKRIIHKQRPFVNEHFVNFLVIPKLELVYSSSGTWAGIDQVLRKLPFFFLSY